MKFKCFWSGHKLTTIVGKRKMVSVAKCARCGAEVKTMLGELVGCTWERSSMAETVECLRREAETKEEMKP